MQNQKILIVGILVAVVALVAGLFLGRWSLRTGRFTAFGQRTPMMGQFWSGPMMGRTFGRGGFGKGALSGQITNISGNQMSLKLTNGNTVTVNLNNTTTFTQVNQLKQSDLKIGENVQVFGARSQDGTVSAQGVQVGGE
jgi:hypothetical protein